MKKSILFLIFGLIVLFSCNGQEQKKIKITPSKMEVSYFDTLFLKLQPDFDKNYQIEPIIVEIDSLYKFNIDTLSKISFPKEDHLSNDFLISTISNLKESHKLFQKWVEINAELWMDSFNAYAHRPGDFAASYSHHYFNEHLVFLKAVTENIDANFLDVPPRPR